MIETINSNVKTGVEASNKASIVFLQMSHSSNQTLTYSERILKSTKSQENYILSVVTITEQTAACTEEVASFATAFSTGMERYMGKSERLNQIGQELKQGLITLSF